MFAELLASSDSIFISATPYEELEQFDDANLVIPKDALMSGRLRILSVQNITKFPLSFDLPEFEEVHFCQNKKRLF